jgi:hypothetical protein
MKPSLLLSSSLLALTACLSNSVLAQTVPLSRAEVKAEFLRARAAGELPSSADLFGPALQQAMQAGKTKTQQTTPSTAKRGETQPSSVAATPQASASATQR